MVNYSPQQTYNQYKIRIIGQNEYGNAYGITIPKAIVEKYNLLNTKFTLEIVNNTLILKS